MECFDTASATQPPRRRLAPTPNDAPQQQGVDPTAKPHLAINLDNRHARIEAFLQRWILIDVDNSWKQSMLKQQLLSICAKMATRARVEHHIVIVAMHRR